MATITLAAPSSASIGVRQARAQVRLTARGRLVVLVTCGVLAFLGLSIGRGPAPAATSDAPAAATAQVVVAPGDTLWSIARTAVPAADPRETIERIRALNPTESSLVTGELVAGQALVVPAR